MNHPGGVPCKLLRYGLDGFVLGVSVKVVEDDSTSHNDILIPASYSEYLNSYVWRGDESAWATPMFSIILRDSWQNIGSEENPYNCAIEGEWEIRVRNQNPGLVGEVLGVTASYQLWGQGVPVTAGLAPEPGFVLGVNGSGFYNVVFQFYIHRR